MPSKAVLIVDDEQHVRMLIRAVLQAEEFATLEAENASAALDIIQDSGDSIAALITDVKMPGELDGLDLADRVRGLHPELPIIVVSGYVPEQERITAQHYTFFQKPFAATELIEAVKRLTRPL